MLPALVSSAGTLPSQKFETAGVSVEFMGGRPLEGEDVTLRFALRGSDGGRLNGVRPAAWIDSRDPKIGGDGTCKDKIQSFLGGTLRARPQVDLNAYWIVTLNVEPSIAVLDPLLGYGGSKLLTAVTLQSPGVDWALSGDQRHIFVSMPLVNRVAVIDTESWSIVKNIDTGFRPARVALHGSMLWVAHENERAADAALTVIDTGSLKAVATIATGRAPHQLAFSPDGNRAFVTNGGDGTVSILDTTAQKKIADVATGPSPAGIASSELSAAAYVIDSDGSIAVIDSNATTVSRRIEARPGLSSITFAPGGRWGFITNAKENAVHVIDSATSAIVTTATDVGENPDQVSFTEDFAYVRAAGSDQVKLIRLAALGNDPEANIATFPGGQIPPEAAGTFSFASAIVAAPEPKSVLVANPADRLVYFYQEGMAAPMGNFRAAGRSPKAALVLDRSLRETEPGVFSIRTKVPAAGRYDVAFFLNEPRVVHCFDLTVRPDPGLKREIAARAVTVEPLFTKKEVHAGQDLEVQFRLTNPNTHQPHRNLKDVRALVFLAPGVWQKRINAEPGQDGVYRVKLTVPRAGIYYVFLESGSLQLKLNASRPFIFEALGK
jgi:YVTN family beta-propeller protein